MEKEQKVEIQEGWDNGELLWQTANGVILYVSPRFADIRDAIANSASMITKKNIKKT